MAQTPSLSPMMQQYLDIKEKNKDSILFFRLGDFYEMFFDDAVTASKELELTLTGKDCGLNERAPMCGVPYHAADTYIARLIQKGYKVTICEQTSLPTGNSRELVKRAVTRVVTPGTVTESGMLSEDKNNYLMSVCLDNDGVGVAWADISTGEFNHTFIPQPVSAKLNDLLSRVEPAEIICNEQMLAESINLSLVKFGSVCRFCSYNETAYDYETAQAAINARLSATGRASLKIKQCVCAAGALLLYISDTQKCAMSNISEISADNPERYMAINPSAAKTLELTQSYTGKKGSLLWCLNRTNTGMGARLLKKWIERPETDINCINARLNLVEEFYKNSVKCNEIHKIFGSMYDIERLTARLSCKKILPVDFLALSRSLAATKELKGLLNGFNSPLALSVYSSLPDFSAECSLIDRAIADKNAKYDSDEQEAEDGKKTKGKAKTNKIFKDGYDEKLDEYRNLLTNTHSVLEQLVSAEKQATGIQKLRIGFTNVFGYYFEVPKTQIAQVPYRYTRRQTVANAERYVTEELKELEAKILGAEELSAIREDELYKELIEKIAIRIPEFLTAAKNVAVLDCIISYAIVARENNYVKPKLTDGSEIKIKEGRHPVVERLLKDERFVPNDALLDSQDNKIMLITGPNMAGKSVYMKQVALIVIMAQAGSFVPALSAEIGIVDKIFTRVGANDDLTSGRSTFMMEMSEVTDILQNATDSSLLLMDEIGRGTSTFDGMSIAQAILEHLSANSKAKVLFSTHYHELTSLEGDLNGVKNYKLTVREIANTIVFLRKLMRGSANKSFGIEVASISGLPDSVVKRAKEILKRLETSEINNREASLGKQISLFVPEGKTHEITKILNELDIDDVTPRNALDILTDLKEKASIQ